MAMNNPRGMVYVCPVCRAEIIVVGRDMGDFAPRCCDTDMIPRPVRTPFYFCPICGAEVVVTRAGEGPLTPRCCNVDMRLIAA